MFIRLIFREQLEVMLVHAYDSATNIWPTAVGLIARQSTARDW